jgi:hypothetical protein
VSSEKPVSKPTIDESPEDKQPDPAQTTNMGLDLKEAAATLPDQVRLAAISTQDLIDLMSDIVVELKSRTGTDTQQIAPAVVSVSFPDTKEADVKEFVRLPATSDKKPAEVADRTWRVTLTSSRRNHAILGLEIFDDVVVGRYNPGEPAPDLDLSKHDGEGLGVSRLHAVLRPTQDGLQLIDFGSTNGTHRNQASLKR